MFDTDFAFDVVRLNHLLVCHLTRLLPLGDPAVSLIVRSSLARLHIFRPTSSTQLSTTLLHLANHPPANAEIGLLAIDSMSAYYWPDRFTVEQLRTINGPKQTPLQYILIALNALHRSHNFITVMTSWDVLSNFQHHSGPSAHSDIVNTASSSRIALSIAPTPQLHQDMRLLSGQDNREGLKQQILASTRTPNCSDVGKFMLHIFANDLLVDSG